VAAKKGRVDEKGNRLTEKQRLFVQCYAGNGLDAAKKAGYRGSEGTLAAIASQNLNKLNVMQAIRERADKEAIPKIKSRHDLQKFWSDVVESPETDMKDRLKASELLGKSEALFTDNLRVDVTMELKKLSDEELDARFNALSEPV
jgi:phage terminase small subunit